MSATTTEIRAKQPDISYHPDLEKYQLRREQVIAQLPAVTGLPPFFPQELQGPLVWEGKEFTDERDWTFLLTEAQLKEIDNALVSFKSS